MSMYGRRTRRDKREVFFDKDNAAAAWAWCVVIPNAEMLLSVHLDDYRQVMT